MTPPACPLRLAADSACADPSLRLEGWLRDIARGDERALRALIAATHDRLLAEAVRLLKSAESAEEVLQDGWMRVWHAAGSFDPRVARPMTWLLRIVQNRAIDMLRSQRRERETTVELDDALAALLPDPAPGPEATLADDTRRRRLHRSLDLLSAEQRQALRLVLLRGYSHQEIAACCRVPESTARTWVRRAVLRLQAQPELRLAA